MNYLWFFLPIVLAIPALYFLLTRKSRGETGGGRVDYSTDSPNDRPPPDAGQARGTD